MHSKIHLLNKRTYLLDIILIATENISYLILIQQDHLGVNYKCLYYYNKHFSDTCESRYWFVQF